MHKRTDMRFLVMRGLSLKGPACAILKSWFRKMDLYSFYIEYESSHFPFIAPHFGVLCQKKKIEVLSRIIDTLRSR